MLPCLVDGADQEVPEPRRATPEAMERAARRAAEIAAEIEPRGYNPAERITVLEPNLEGQTDRPLRYSPDGTDFVIVNGEGLYNRSLYGRNTGFRVDTGDRPEFVLYLRGRGGNLRFGLRGPDGAKWLQNAERIEARYRPGSMIYAIRDPLLGDATLRLTGMSLFPTDGLITRVELEGNVPEDLELIWAYGGVNGEGSPRGGDIGTEGMPLAEYFQLQPEFSRDNRYDISDNRFTLQSRAADIHGVSPVGATLEVADANAWHESPEALLASAGSSPDLPVVVGHAQLRGNGPAYLSLQRVEGDNNNPDYDLAPPYSAEDLPGLFEQNERTRAQRAAHVTVDTPDPFINAAVGAINMSVDAVFDEPTGTVMHGAVAWRSRLLGWRGGYSPDAFGWHDRARRHFSYWPTQQDTDPIPEELPPHDPEAHLARNEPGLRSRGAMSFNHYDMNVVFIDALFRHLMWTGDLEFAREVWPTIERHLAWERRLFRRMYGVDEDLPLYEAYTVIWASDDLQYNGSGVTHSSAYNYYHNKMAARLARLLGEDPSRYEAEAEAIRQALRRVLWMPERGWYAEYKDLLGNRLLHPSAATWTVYHSVDSEAVDPFEAAQLMRYTDTHFARLPLRGPGVPEGDWFTIPSSNWMPYSYSINNVVVAEATHTSLAYWQTGRNETAFRLFKGVVLDNMFMGAVPGNLGMTTRFDAARGEAQRDFADATGVMSRSVVEGLFGVVPDRLEGIVRLTPGFPAEWEHASIEHPDFDFAYRRDGTAETYRFTNKFGEELGLRLRVPARRDRVEEVRVNGEPVSWRVPEERVGDPRLEIETEPLTEAEVTIRWSGEAPANVPDSSLIARDQELNLAFDPAEALEVKDPQTALENARVDGATLRGIATGKGGHRTVFVRLRQGDLDWWQPVPVEIRPELEVLPAPNQEAGSLRFALRNNTAETIEAEARIRSGSESWTVPVRVPGRGGTADLDLDAGPSLLPGTNRVTVDLGDNRQVRGDVVNWFLDSAPQTIRHVPLDDHFNDQVTQIFKNAYLSPRSPYVSLSLPVQGIGSWAHFDETFTVVDRGLRETAAENDGVFPLSIGIGFAIPTEETRRNIAFTSQWDNFPEETTVPLDGTARRLYLLMAGSTYWMQSRIDNGEVIVEYADGSRERLPLRNPTTWWPINRDYFIDDYAFKRESAVPPRVLLATGQTRIVNLEDFKGTGTTVPGGAGTVLDVPLDPEKELASLTLRTLANEVVIGLMGATLAE